MWRWGNKRSVKQARFSKYQDGIFPDEALECRYYDEDLQAWSKSGTSTVELDGTDNVGCASRHLSDFIAVKVLRRIWPVAPRAVGD